MGHPNVLSFNKLHITLTASMFSCFIFARKNAGSPCFVICVTGNYYLFLDVNLGYTMDVLTILKYRAMGNKPKKNSSSLSKLKKELQTIKKTEQNKIKGGKGRGKWNPSCGDIVPQ